MWGWNRNQGPLDSGTVETFRKDHSHDIDINSIFDRPLENCASDALLKEHDMSIDVQVGTFSRVYTTEVKLTHTCQNVSLRSCTTLHITVVCHHCPIGNQSENWSTIVSATD